jgi:predicted extracellular nuclease
MPLTIATYNVLDLFDPEDAASRGRLDRRIAKLASRLREADADVVALQEIASKEALLALARATSSDYSEPIVARADKRGIACAILTRRPVLAVEMLDASEIPFPVFRDGDPAPFHGRIPLRRAVPIVRVDGGELGPVTVASVHFKSRRGVPRRDALGTEIPATRPGEEAEEELRSLVLRAAEALFVRHAVDRLFGGQPDELLAICGDFNDVVASTPVRIVMGRGGFGLHSCAQGIPSEQRISVRHGGEPAAIDHVLASARLFERVQSARFLNDGLHDPDALPEGVGPEDSDHAPLVVRFA